MWDVKNPGPLMRVLDAWHDVLPDLVLDNILENLVLPKLAMQVEDWNPRVDTVPIDKWLHPWLPFFGTRLEPFYAPIRNKLATVLKEWHPSDKSAQIILSPWKPVFDAASWDGLMTRAILPKLTEAMHTFEVNPRQQDIGPFEWAMRWADLIPMPRMVHLMETEFFPKWQQVLYTWLSSNPNYEEIMRWYVGWKSQFSESMVANDRIRLQFTHALTVMDNAITGGSGYRPTPFVPPPASEERKPAKPLPVVEDSMNFKEIIEHFADSNGLLLMKTSKMHEGNPVFQLGKVSIFLDNVKQLVYKQIKGEWTPVSLDDLLKQ
jgi:tuftelin-interacting protein 11